MNGLAMALIEDDGIKEGKQNAEEIKVSVQVSKPEISEPLMEHMELTQKGAPRLGMIFLIGALTIAGVCAFLFAREMMARKQMELEIVRTEQARVQLEQSMVELQAEMANQREEIKKLSTDLQVAQAKAALVDKLREEHQQQIARLKNRYEGELTALRNVLQVKESLIASFQSNLKGIREALQKGEIPAVATAGVVAFETGQAKAPAGSVVQPQPSVEFKPVSGSVLTVDRDNRFIVMDLNPTVGAQVGRFVQIYHQDQVIGQGRIDRVYQSLSAATVLSDDTLSRVEKGDRVILVLA